MAHPFDLVFFPEEPSAVPDVPALQLAVLGPDRPRGEETRAFVERCMATHGAAPRRFGNSLLWAIPDAPGSSRRQPAATWRGRAGAERRDPEEDQRAQLAEQKGAGQAGPHRGGLADLPVAGFPRA